MDREIKNVRKPNVSQKSHILLVPEPVLGSVREKFQIYRKVVPNRSVLRSIVRRVRRGLKDHEQRNFVCK
jgi:hypothetical protein